MEFGALGEHVLVDDASFLSVAGVFDQISVALWSKVDVANSSAFWGQSAGLGGGRGIQAHLPWSDNTIYFDTSGCCNGETQRISKNISDLTADDPKQYFAKWHHFVFTKDGSTKRIYVDGELFHEGENTAPLAQDFNDLFLGSSDDNGGGSEHGSMDEFAVFASVLSDANIKALAGGKSINEAFGPFQPPPPTGGKFTAIKVQAGNVVIEFTGSGVQSADSILGPWTDVGGNSPLTVPAAGGPKFYRFKP
jgi:hypothetical protein